MQNKGLIKLFAILFGLVSIYQLSFTFIANNVEDKAEAYAEKSLKVKKTSQKKEQSLLTNT